jgi:ribulose-5-phosphate 4-epimerase/fuculose-1-phosphate aldolase
LSTSFGGMVEEAVWWFIAMERCCQAQFLAESVSKPLQIDPENARANRQQVARVRRR